MAQHGAKMATCCYCGSHTALVLTGQVQHELACGSCGAPLHKMKTFPAKPRKPAAARPRKKAAALPEDFWSSATARPKRRKRRKSLSRKVASEIFDLIEDILD